MLDKIRELLGMKNIPENELRTEIKRPTWDHTFLRMAIDISYRSHDADTQCGCVLVRGNTPLSTGYNGFIRSIDDTVLPNIRPHKYPFMIHAEINAILNCARLGMSTIDSTCYVTTKPCLSCFQFLWQAGVTRIVYTDFTSSKNWNHSEADDQIEALLMLINPIGARIGELDGTIRDCIIEKMKMDFIPKNEIKN